MILNGMCHIRLQHDAKTLYAICVYFYNDIQKQ